jgi:hypothetical protein
MLFRFVWIFTLPFLLFVASQQELALDGCESDSEKLSSQQMKTLLRKTEPIHLPGTVDKLHIKGTVMMALAVNDKGEVDSVRIISGNPLILGATIESTSQWKFRPYVVRGLRKGFCGKIAIRYQAGEQGVRYRVVEEPRFNLSFANRTKIDFQI